ncbi:cytochrome c biogenesis CcdA family protein [Pseudonocardia oceani]|uniref:Cytochrome c biogenesis protein CcdA n=2 Tax=Pseudonocardia oceani TaxID=2792013 RepID=A0ABS6U2P9_9PSEU|nr:cytochrome c biogenesis CcdA family protein [Pseudonocardia oceani]MBW0092463.1 cytochrome c biogenesis protein CcdA [Pseudonocardia oceani]MBW0121948.1 cytochrome c biogenesis protein CcdA [Pseudonocardia oceani]MBW0126498.1 cytochrome c biogenesis protein CcdA [Pseudonocardia oceani]
MELFALVSLALVAGAVSFSSPCVLPLLPGYVSYVSALCGAPSGVGAPASTLGLAQRRRVRLGAGLFVAGFATVFTVLGATASALGLLLRQNLGIINLVGGAVVVVLGLAMTGLLRIPLLQRQARFELTAIGTGPGGAFPLGAAFAFAWTPCVGPVLASILTAVAGSADPGRGAVLLLAYALGLGAPFLVLAAGVARGRDRFRWLRNHARWIEIAGGIGLAITGVLMMTGGWTLIMSRMLSVYARLQWPPI